MPEVTITVGERNFVVACQEGEEHFLRAAAKMVDAEAMGLLGQIGRMPESRMLLMSSLLLADKTAAMEDQLRKAEARLAALQADVETHRVAPQRVEVPVIPAAVIDALSELAARAEAVADRIEQVRAH